MTDLTERIIAELRAESDLVPPAVPEPVPTKGSRWGRYSIAVAAVSILVLGTLWLANRTTTPVASSVTVSSVSGDSNSELVELWSDWWRGYAEVRETAAVFEDGGFGFDPSPVEELAIDFETALLVADIMFKVEVGGGFVQVGEPSEIRLAPIIEIEGSNATIRDCVYLDPIPWPGLRQEDSTGGTVVMVAKAESTDQGWKISDFGPEFIGRQFASEPCLPGDP